MTTVLLIEDNQGDATLVREHLHDKAPEEYKLIHVVRISEAIEILKKDHNIDVIISDIALPDSQGIESFHSLRKVAANLPVIFFTGTHDESLASSALQKGAQDYLLKGQYEGETLRRAIRYAVERKKFQNDAERSRARARKLRQRTATLRHEREELQKLNKAKDDFISLASHQLRTPATGVKQYVGMILEGFAGEIPLKQREMLEQAYSSNERQLKTINDLLETARLDSGRTTLVRKKCELVELLRQVIDEQKQLFSKRKQQVRFSANKEKILTMIDADKFRMALENIIDNASKYTPSGKNITIAIADYKKKIVITVADEGVGIDKSDIDKVFDKFARISNHLSEEVGGSGLGLYWAKSIVDMHGGNITVDSRLAKGTTFTVTLYKEESA